MRSLRIVTQALVAVEYMYRDQEEIAGDKAVDKAGNK
jgi:hypothetical protein